MSVCILSLLGLFVPREDGKSGGGGSNSEFRLVGVAFLALRYYVTSTQEDIKELVVWHKVGSGGSRGGFLMFLMHEPGLQGEPPLCR